jgi:hypothetical protein
MLDFGKNKLETFDQDGEPDPPRARSRSALFFQSSSNLVF